MTGGGESVVTMGKSEVARWMDGGLSNGGGGVVDGGIVTVSWAGQVGMVERVDAESGTLGGGGS